MFVHFREPSRVHDWEALVAPKREAVLIEVQLMAVAADVRREVVTESSPSKSLGAYFSQTKPQAL